MRMFFLILNVLLFSAPVHAMEKACTMIGCLGGFELGLNGQWPAGQYTFEIDADGKTTTCRSSLPFHDCTSTTTCDGEGITIGESGCALAPEFHGFHMIGLKDVPSHVSVHVTGDKGQSFSYETMPEKTCGYPNGKDCDPEPCCSARTAIDIKWQ